MIHVVLAENDPYMQDYLSSMLLGAGKFSLDAVVSDAFEAEALCERGIDLVLMDVHTQRNHSGLAAGKRIKEKHPHVKVVVVTSLVDPEVLVQAKSGYADSLWYKDHGKTGILDVIDRTMNGEHVFPDEVPTVELGTALSSIISPIQYRILRLYIRGYTYGQIAEKCNLSVSGVKFHINQLVKDGGFSSKEELIATIISNKVIQAFLKEE